MGSAHCQKRANARESRLLTSSNTVMYRELFRVHRTIGTHRLTTNAESQQASAFCFARRKVICSQRLCAVALGPTARSTALSVLKPRNRVRSGQCTVKTAPWYLQQKTLSLSAAREWSELTISLRSRPADFLVMAGIAKKICVQLS